MTSGSNALDRSLSRLDTVLFRTDTVAICRFRCSRQDPMFGDSPATANAILVFPRTAVGIRHLGGEAYVSNPTRVAFYNAGQEFTRWPISSRGARADWIWIRPDVLGEIVQRHDPSAEERTGRPFSFAWGPAETRLYLEQRRVVTAAAAGGADPLHLEEAVLGIATRAVGDAFAFRGRARTARSQRDHRRQVELVEKAIEILSRRMARDTTLTALGRELSVSPFHLCRTFARHTGSTLSAYRGQMRLRLSLERLRDPRANLSAIAYDLGYSSHSHFTMAFRRAFGTTPSEFRARPGRAGHRDLPGRATG
jgi:AraC-like DNA-binding protein